MNGSTGIGLDLLIGVHVCVYIKPDTKRLMSVICVEDVFPNTSNKHAMAAMADPITVYSYGLLFNCTTVGQASDSMTALT